MQLNYYIKLLLKKVPSDPQNASLKEIADFACVVKEAFTSSKGHKWGEHQALAQLLPLAQIDIDKHLDKYLHRVCQESMKRFVNECRRLKND